MDESLMDFEVRSKLREFLPKIREYFNSLRVEDLVQDNCWKCLFGHFSRCFGYKSKEYGCHFLFSFDGDYESLERDFLVRAIGRSFPRLFPDYFLGDISEELYADSSDDVLEDFYRSKMPNLGDWLCEKIKEELEGES